jgi:hypothetical protein
MLRRETERPLLLDDNAQPISNEKDRHSSSDRKSTSLEYWRKIKPAPEKQGINLRFSVHDWETRKVTNSPGGWPERSSYFFSRNPEKTFMNIVKALGTIDQRMLHKLKTTTSKVYQRTEQQQILR